MRKGFIQIRKSRLKRLILSRKYKIKDLARIYNCSKCTISERIARFKLKMNLLRDFTGQRFHHIQVLGLAYVRRGKNGKIKGRKTYWHCVCDCGKKVIMCSHKFKENSKAHLSCGCRYGLKLSRPQIKDRTIPTKNMVYKDCKRNADFRGYSFEFSFDEFCKKSEQKCYYCGAEPTLKNWGNSTISKSEWYANGIDRIDNSLGYTTKNSVACCKRCNIAKNNMSKKEFMNMIKAIYERHFK